MRIAVFFDHILQAQEQTGKSLEVLLQGVRQAGVEAVEIRLAYLLEHKETMRLLEQAELKISCIYEFYEMERVNEQEKAGKHIDTAIAVGAGRILVVPGFLHGWEAKRMQGKMSDAQAIEKFMSRNRKIRRMLENLSYIAKLGQEKGIVVTVEDFDDKKSPLSGMHGIHWFLKQIPQLQYTLDTGNYLFYEEDMLEAFSLLQDRIAHVHCKDRQAGTNASVTTGTGYIPFEEVVKRLKEQNYKGYLAIEHFDIANQEGCIRKSAEFLNNIIFCNR